MLFFIVMLSVVMLSAMGTVKLFFLLSDVAEKNKLEYFRLKSFFQARQYYHYGRCYLSEAAHEDLLALICYVRLSRKKLFMDVNTSL